MNADHQARKIKGLEKVGKLLDEIEAIANEKPA
jgi:hypothetical protein